MSQVPHPEQSPASDEILDRVDAFLRRRRAGTEPNLIDDDIPLLTDIVADPALQSQGAPIPAAPPAWTSAPEPEFDTPVFADEAPASPSPAYQPAPAFVEPPAPQMAQPSPLQPALPPIPPLAVIREEEIAAQVARRVEEALAEHRVNLAVALDDWLNFDLPRLVAQEMDGVADRIIARASDELRRMVHALPPPGEH